MAEAAREGEAAARGMERDEVAQEFARRVRAVAPGARVYARWFEGVLDLWVVLEEFNTSVELAIADALGEVMEHHDEVLLDFMFTTAEDPAVSTVAEETYALVNAG